MYATSYHRHHLTIHSYNIILGICSSVSCKLDVQKGIANIVSQRLRAGGNGQGGEVPNDDPNDGNEVGNDDDGQGNRGQ